MSLLFLIWGNSFIAINFLLGNEGENASLNWYELVYVRFFTAFLPCFFYCLVLRRKNSVDTIRRYWRRLIVCGLLMVVAYNGFLNLAQQLGLSPPIASMMTGLVPLFMTLYGRFIFGEELELRRIISLILSLVGLFVIATAKSDLGFSNSGLVLIAAMAPLSWTGYSVLSKPILKDVDPLLWTFLSLIIGFLCFWPFTFHLGYKPFLKLNWVGLFFVLYLSLLATVLGFVLWTWIVKQIDASSAGMLIFLNPPVTFLSKVFLVAVMPAYFSIKTQLSELVGASIVTIGLIYGFTPSHWFHKKNKTSGSLKEAK